MWIAHYSVRAGASGGVVLVSIPKYISFLHCNKNSERDITWETQCILELTKEGKQEEIAGNLFVGLLKELATNSTESVEQ